MLGAINFYYQFCGMAIKIGNKISYGLLPLKSNGING